MLFRGGFYHEPPNYHCAPVPVLLKDGRLEWTGSYGYADIDQGREVTDSTLFYLASISKTVTATAESMRQNCTGTPVVSNTNS